jgi:hypothetical protein
VHERALFDLGRFRTSRAEHRTDDLLDARTAALVVQDTDVFESDKGLEDLTRVSDNESVSCFLAHTSPSSQWEEQSRIAERFTWSVCVPAWLGCRTAECCCR